MERELKIVLSVFLAFFIYALTTWFNSGEFLAPFPFAKICLVIVALLFVVLNMRTPKYAILWLYLVCTLLFALTDEFTVQYLDYKTGLTFFNELASNYAFLVTSFLVFIGFLYFSVIFYVQTHKKPVQTSLLFLLLTGFILSFFIDLTVLRHILIHLFFILFFVFSQGDSDLKNKTLRVIAYQYLLIPLLQSFEYFI
jgi:hypothetical protein